MKAKYFTAAEQGACLAAAGTYFQKEPALLSCRFLTPQDGTGVLLLAIDPGEAGLAAVNNMDACFSLEYTQKGVELSLFESRGSGKKLDPAELDFYLQRKNLSELNQAAKKWLLNIGWGSVIIAPPQQEYILNEDVLILVDDDELKATARILPGEQGGQPLSMERLQQALVAAEVRHGLNEIVIRMMMQERMPHKKYPVARATQPQHGEDGRLEYHFRREFSGRPRIGQDGRVDYRELDLFESVKEGQLLVTRILATPGTPGRTVRDKVIPCVPGKNARLPLGKNVKANEDSTQLYATSSGMVVANSGSVNVYNLYTVTGNADMKVGNIDFDGSIYITGNVIAGLTIKASGNIEVGGMVESSNLIAGGNIVVRGGSQGMNRGLLQAEGNITVNYVERTTVIAGGVVTANIIAHSIVEAGDSIVLSGKNGSLIGGSTRVSNTLSAQIIGSLMEMPTEIEVGLVPMKRQRISFLRQELKRLEGEVQKLSTIIDYLDKNPSEDPKKVSMRFTVGQSLAHNTQVFEQLSEEFENLQIESANSVHGKIHVSDTIYPGVRLTIASESYRVENISPHCSFRVSNNEVVMGVYEG